MKDIKGLTGLRGFAALWVCIYHYTYENDFGWILTPLAHAGHHGVPIFFILSGFILAYIYGKRFAEGREGYWHFLLLRVARIYPLHLVVLLFIGASVYYGFRQPASHDTPESFIAGLAMVHAWGFTPAISWNEPSWSVSTEFFAYLLFPLFAGRLVRAGVCASALLIGVILLVFMTNTNVWLGVKLSGAIGMPGAFGFAPGGGLLHWLLMFVAGVALFQVSEWLRPRIREAGFYDALTVAGLVLLLVPQVFGEIPWWQLILASLLIVAGLYRDAGPGRALFGNPVSNWLGDISYALYLGHVALVYVWVYALGEFMPNTYFHQVPLLIKLAAAVLLAVALHYGIERPARSALRSLLATSSRSKPAVSL
jgi:peptidoglycan/LPS O-acetylase OafA/YrhL